MSALSLLLAASLLAADRGEEVVLTAARVQTTDKTLLNFFRKRSQPASRQDVIEQLARTLTDKETPLMPPPFRVKRR